jgi:hypothetical protein
MKLREKFENILCDWIDKDYNREFVAKQIEIDADDYAIEFAEWLTIKYPNQRKFLLKQGDLLGFYTTKELLEIFKKEKGL